MTRKWNLSVDKDKFERLLQQIGCEDRLGDLFLYVDGPENLDLRTRTLLEKHLAACAHCRKELQLARAHLDKASTETLPDWVREIGCSEDGIRKPTAVLKDARWMRDPSAKAGDISFLVFQWISQSWKPLFAGVAVTASDISEQTHVFKMADGEIQLSCRWFRHLGHKPAYIRLSWKMRMRSRGELYVRFTHVETGDALAAIRLGTGLEGEASITSRKLGFDPSTTPWEICLMITRGL